MGFRLDFKVDREFIDHGPDNKPYYHEEIHITGNSITDTICIKQGNDIIGMSDYQFKELIQEVRKSSLWYSLGLDK